MWSRFSLGGHSCLSLSPLWDLAAPMDVCVWHHWVHLVRVGLFSWRACWGGLSRAQAQLKAADFCSGVVLPENQPLMGPQPWLGCGGGNQHPMFLQRPVGSQGEPWGADTILWFEAVQ